MDKLTFKPSAFKHGMSEEDIRHVWRYGQDYPYRIDDDVELRIGHDTHGRLAEVLGQRTPYGWSIHHAMTPPTETLKRATRKGRR